MLERHDPSRVLCGHCGRERSTGACRGCGRQVCDGCARDVATCPKPRAFAIRLGLGARLRHVARGGAVGLVSTLTGRLWLLDLVNRTRLAAAGWSYRWSSAMAQVGGVSERGELLWPRTFTRRYDNSLRLTTVGVDDRSYYFDPPVARLGFDRSGRFLAGPTVDERLVIAPLSGGEPELVAPLSRRVIQAFDVDMGSGVVAAATHGELGVFRVGGDRPLAPMALQRDDCAWVGVVGERIAVAVGNTSWAAWVAGTATHQLTIFELSGREIAPIYSARQSGDARLQPRTVADVSDDGRFVAVALASREIAVHDVEEGGVQRLGGHSDAISTIRFGPGGAFMISGDFDNRVIVRFRDGGRFVDDAEELEVL